MGSISAPQAYTAAYCGLTGLFCKKYFSGGEGLFPDFIAQIILATYRPDASRPAAVRRSSDQAGSQMRLMPTSQAGKLLASRW